MKTLEITGEVAGGSLPRLVRSSPHYLEVVGLKCGIRKPWMKEPCGGKLRVEDFRPKGVRGELRYELHCDKCKECDPNGWARQDKLIPAALEHFDALPDTANAELSDGRGDRSL